MKNNIVEIKRLFQKLENIAKTASTKQTKTSFEQWADEIISFNQPSNSPQELQAITVNKLYGILYYLEITYSEYKIPILRINIYISNKLKNGNYSSNVKKFLIDVNTHFQSMLPEDSSILHNLELNYRAQANKKFGAIKYKDSYSLNSTDGEIFEKIVKTNRCYWVNNGNRVLLQLREQVSGCMDWVPNDAGEQKLCCKVNDQLVTTLPFYPAWYLDDLGHCGKLGLGLNQAAEKLLFISPILPNYVAKMKTILKEHFSDTAGIIPYPAEFEIIAKTDVEPRPKLRLFGLFDKYHYLEDYDDYYDYDDNRYDFPRKSKAPFVPLARISFIYEGREIAINQGDSIPILDRSNNTITNIIRDFAAESTHIGSILGSGAQICDLDMVKGFEIEEQDFLIAQPLDLRAQEFFLNNFIPELKKLGWEIDIDRSFLVECVRLVEDWYSQVIETKDYNWFDLELGLVVDGERVNLLPLLIDLIKKDPKIFNEQFFAKTPQKYYPLTLDNGQKIKIAVKRLQGIFSVLSELYDVNSLNKSGLLSISRLRAAQLLELSKAMETTRLRWHGADKLQELSQKLTNFTSIKPVDIPATFEGKLRDYQQHGVNWLGFLREYKLGGILSDDMGLGKTIQALAYIAAEKHANRIQAPCLVVAPTSLMSNWRNESSRFTPNFKVIVLHGQNRKQWFEQLLGADLILTTYALLLRDKEVLLNCEYDLIVLDEAQYIKNANTYAYQIIQQLKAQHRICLTGTPIENHLGELWSLFNFLSPGLLGSSRQFVQIFRTPIEKQGNSTRKHSLNQRIYPYMLRRTKEEVIKELPSKTEIVHNIELQDEQRDLYESIRLSMHAKLQQMIQEKGLAGSQIFILDALLKLRQICCDPRLLKLKQANKFVKSSKLDFLLNMLLELVEKGRKVLIFSSFASMLGIIEEELKKSRISYVIITGATVDRETPIATFQSGSVSVFLLSLKAGGTGLNLTAADTVIHYDPWWNPAAEAQATDRAYRIGQTKPIFVYKFITVGTVEEKILLMQGKKKELLQGLFTSQASTNLNFTKEDLNLLFQPIEKI